jgi:hypothetical protein
MSSVHPVEEEKQASLENPLNYEAQQIVSASMYQASQEQKQEPFLGTLPPQWFVFLGVLLAFFSAFFPQMIPFALLFLLYLLLRKKTLLYFILFLGLLSLFLPVIEVQNLYCEDCSALRVSVKYYYLSFREEEELTAFAEWYKSIVEEHSRHHWKLYQQKLHNLVGFKIAHFGGEDQLPYPKLGLFKETPFLLTLFKKMKPLEALQLFSNWQDLCENETFLKALQLWNKQKDTNAFLPWLYTYSPETFRKVQFVLDSSIRPIPKLKSN